MHVATRAIVIAVSPHGEHGAIVRALTPTDGLLPGYVRGGRSRRLRPVLMPGNLIEAEFRARTDTQLAALTAELAVTRAPLLAEPLAAAAIAWVCALVAAVLPEGQPYPRVHDALDGLLAAIEAAPSALGWAPGLVRFEIVMIAETGFGLDRWERPRIDPAAPVWPQVMAALEETGARLSDIPMPARALRAFDARERLMERLKRAAG